MCEKRHSIKVTDLELCRHILCDNQELNNRTAKYREEFLGEYRRAASYFEISCKDNDLLRIEETKTKTLRVRRREHPWQAPEYVMSSTTPRTWSCRSMA